MILPLADDNSDRKLTPWVNYGLIAVNVLVFVVFQGLGTDDVFTFRFSTIPEEIVTGRDISGQVIITDERGGQHPLKHQEVPLTPYLTLLTSMFMHGGIAHLLGNMLFLWIFGDNLEDEMGHVRYLIYYLICGVLASLCHVASTFAFADEASRYIPSLGASGAISGVLGGYLLLFPNRRVLVLLVRFVTHVPAWVAIGLWFVFQVVQSMGFLGGQGGIAYGAHIGGFIVGLALVKPFTLGKPWGA